jgi:hypothetical protein
LDDPAPAKDLVDAALTGTQSQACRDILCQHPSCNDCDICSEDDMTEEEEVVGETDEEFIDEGEDFEATLDAEQEAESDTRNLSLYK